jgi:hypothetical protein
MDERLALAQPATRNVWAYTGFWFVVMSWVGLIARFAVGDVGSFTNALDWFYLAALCCGIIAGAAGVLAIRKRGEPRLAIATFAFSLVLPMLYLVAVAVLWLLLGLAGAGAGGTGD